MLEVEPPLLKETPLHSELPVHMLSSRDLYMEGTKAKIQNLWLF